MDLAASGDQGAALALGWVKQVSDVGEVVVGLPDSPNEVIKLLTEVGRTVETFTMARLISYVQEHGEMPSHVTVKIATNYETL